MTDLVTPICSVCGAPATKRVSAQRDEVKICDSDGCEFEAFSDAGGPEESTTEAIPEESRSDEALCEICGETVATRNFVMNPQNQVTDVCAGCLLDTLSKASSGVIEDI